MMCNKLNFACPPRFLACPPNFFKSWAGVKILAGSTFYPPCCPPKFLKETLEGFGGFTLLGFCLRKNFGGLLLPSLVNPIRDRATLCVLAASNGVKPKSSRFKSFSLLELTLKSGTLNQLFKQQKTTPLNSAECGLKNH